MLVKLCLKSVDLDFDIVFDLVSFALHFGLVFEQWASFSTLYLFLFVCMFLIYYWKICIEVFMSQNILLILIIISQTISALRFYISCRN